MSIGFPPSHAFVTNDLLVLNEKTARVFPDMLNPVAAVRCAEGLGALFKGGLELRCRRKEIHPSRGYRGPRRFAPRNDGNMICVKSNQQINGLTPDFKRLNYRLVTLQEIQTIQLFKPHPFQSLPFHRLDLTAVGIDDLNV